MHFHLLSGSHSYPFSSILINFHPLSSTFIHFHPLSSTPINSHPLSSTSINSHSSSSTLINSHPRLILLSDRSLFFSIQLPTRGNTSHAEAISSSYLVEASVVSSVQQVRIVYGSFRPHAWSDQKPNLTYKRFLLRTVVSSSLYILGF